jgi:orotate phosphoribosyltransferase
MTKRTPVSLEEMVAAIERNKGSVSAAAAALDRTEQAIYKRLSDNGLVIEVTGVVVRKVAAA